MRETCTVMKERYGCMTWSIYKVYKKLLLHVTYNTLSAEWLPFNCRYCLWLCALFQNQTHYITFTTQNPKKKEKVNVSETTAQYMLTKTLTSVRVHIVQSRERRLRVSGGTRLPPTTMWDSKWLPNTAEPRHCKGISPFPFLKQFGIKGWKKCCVYMCVCVCREGEGKRLEWSQIKKKGLKEPPPHTHTCNSKKLYKTYCGCGYPFLLVCECIFVFSLYVCSVHRGQYYGDLTYTTHLNHIWGRLLSCSFTSLASMITDMEDTVNVKITVELSLLVGHCLSIKGKVLWDCGIYWWIMCVCVWEGG